MAGNHLLRLFLVFTLFGCAVPRGPSGGPGDREGPWVVETFPPTGTVHFTGKKVSFRFNEYIDRNAFRKAVSVQPDLTMGFEIDFGKFSGSVIFGDALPENTTIIVNLSTELTDANRNKLATPYTLALSTGAQIDQGKLTGKVLDFQTGRPPEFARVFLYSASDSSYSQSRYRQMVDTAGTFRFEHIVPEPYRLLYLEDRNGNFALDSNEYVQPFDAEFYPVEDDTVGVDAGSVFVNKPDTTKPNILGVGSLSSQRLRIRFSEEITLTDSARVVAEDSLGNARPGRMLYFEPNDKSVGYVFFAKALSGAKYELSLRGFEDRAFNMLEETFSFSSNTQPDTTSLRIIEIRNGSGHRQNEALEVIYAKPIDQISVVDSLLFFAGEQEINAEEVVQIASEKLLIKPPTGWQAGVPYEVRIWSPATQQWAKHKPTIWFDNDLSSLQISGADSVATYVLQLSQSSREKSLRIRFSGSITLQEIIPETARIRLFKDENGNGRRDNGLVNPFAAPEPVLLQTIPLPKGFTAQVEMDF